MKPNSPFVDHESVRTNKPARHHIYFDTDQLPHNAVDLPMSLNAASIRQISDQFATDPGYDNSSIWHTWQLYSIYPRWVGHALAHIITAVCTTDSIVRQYLCC